MSSDPPAGPSFDEVLEALRTSSARLRSIVEALDPGQITASAYPAEWTVADTLSHIGSGAIILRRALDDSMAGASTPEDFAPSVWDEWNAKEPAAQAADALAANAALVERLGSLTDDERAGVTVSMGPMTLDVTAFAGLRLNELALHLWDVDVTFDPAATVRPEAVRVVVDGLGMIAQWSGTASDEPKVVTVHTTSPERDVTLTLGPGAVSLTPADGGGAPDIELPAEAFIRLVYGRLDPDHTPPIGNAALLDELRATFPGP